MKTKINKTKTYTLELSEIEMAMMWHRFNLSESKFSEVYCPDEDVPYPEDNASVCHKMWSTLDYLLRYDREMQS